MTGLATGIDTAAMVKQLMNAESMKMNKLKQKRQLLEWKQQAYRDVAGSLKGFQASMLSLTSPNSLRMVANYNNTKATVTTGGAATDAVKVSANGAQKARSITLEVASVAQRDSFATNTINKFTASRSFLSVDDNINEKMLAYLRKSVDENRISFTVSLDGGPAQTITFDQADYNELTKVILNDAGTGWRYGAEEALSKGLDKVLERVNIKLKQSFGTDTFKTNPGNPVMKVELKKTDDNLFFFEAGPGHTAVIGQGVKGSDGRGLDALTLFMGFDAGGSTAVNLNDSLYKQGWLDENQTAMFQIGDEFLIFNWDDSLQTMIDKFNEASKDIVMRYDANQAKFFLESRNTGQGSKIDFTKVEGDVDFFRKMGFDTVVEEYINTSPNSIFPDGKMPTKISLKTDSAQYITEGSDAVFFYNGLQMSRMSNTFEIDGVGITLGTDAAGTIADPKVYRIDIKNDITQTKDMIKQFVDEYNNLIELLNKHTSTARPKSGEYTYYEPLSEDEKRAMSEREVEMWEEKAKTGLLYRDSVLSSIHAELRNMLYTSVTREDGSKISLPQIGITTSNENGYIGKLVINEVALNRALENNMDGVIDLFTKTARYTQAQKDANEIPLQDGFDVGDTMQGNDVKSRRLRMAHEGLGDRLDDIIRNVVEFGGSISRRAGIEGTATVVSNDMYRQISAQDARINEMLRYLYSRETHYYNMFSKMESAIMKSNTQMESLMGMMGGA